MDKKKLLIIGGSVGGAALIALVVVSLIIANSPSALIVRGAANTIADIKRLEVYDVADDVINGGSVSVSANLDKYAKDDLSVQAKINTNAKDLKGSFEISFAEDGDEVLKANITGNQDKVTFECDEFFDGTYGVNFKNLVKNLPESIFDPDEETDYSLYDEQFEYFMNLKDTIKNDKNLERDITSMTAKYRKLAIEKLIKYAECSKSSETIKAGSDKISCSVVKVTVDEEALGLILQDLIDYAGNDEELENLVFRIASNAAIGREAEDIVDDFYDTLDYFEDGLDYIEDLDFELNISVYITKSGRRIARIDAEAEVDGEGYDFSLILGRNVTTSKDMSLSIKNKETGEGYDITYTVKANNSKAYEAEFQVEESYIEYDYIDYGWDDDDDYVEYLDTRTSTLKVEWDKSGGDLKIRYKDKWDDYVVKGSLLQKGDRYIFVLTNVREDGEAVALIKSLELTVIVDRHDPSPNPAGRFTEVTTMNVRDFKHLAEDIKDGVEDFTREYFR